MSTFDLRVGDRRPWLAYSLGMSFVGVTSVTFSARDKMTGIVFIDDQPAFVANGVYNINGVSTALTPADGVLMYQWQEADVAAVRASAEGLFRVVWDTGEPETFPSTGVIRFVIRENF